MRICQLKRKQILSTSKVFYYKELELKKKQTNRYEWTYKVHAVTFLVIRTSNIFLNALSMLPSL